MNDPTPSPHLGSPFLGNDDDALRLEVARLTARVDELEKEKLPERVGALEAGQLAVIETVTVHHASISVLETQRGEVAARLTALEVLSREIREDGREVLRLLRKTAELDDRIPDPDATPNQRTGR